MDFDVQSRGKYTIIALHGEVNLYTVSIIRNQIYEFLDQNLEKYKHLILDLSDAYYVDSSGLAFFSRLQKKVKDVDGSFALMNVNAKVGAAIRIASLDQYFQVFHNLEEIPN